MSTGWIVFFIILAVLIVAFIALYFYGKKMQKKNDEAQAQIDAAKRPVTVLVIDKKKMPIREAGLPPQVYEQTPRLMRRSKLPIVKVKAGPQIMNLVADEKIFDQIPVKQEVVAMVSGIYITEVRGKKGKPLPKVDDAANKSRFSRWVSRLREKAGAGQVKRK